MFTTKTTDSSLQSRLLLSIYRFGDQYEWNKVTTCVHNILSGQRWIEHYGEITIRNTKSSACLCKLTFVKVERPSAASGRKWLTCIAWSTWRLSSRETTGVLMWMRFKDLWWIKKGKWSTGFLGNGTRAFTVASRPPPNASGGQVGTRSLDFTVWQLDGVENEHKFEFILKIFASVLFSPCQARCRQIMSCTTASPGLPLNWMNFAPCWKMFCPEQTPDSGLIKGTASHPPPRPNATSHVVDFPKTRLSWGVRLVIDDWNVPLHKTTERLSFVLLLLFFGWPSDVWVTQASGRGELSDGNLRQAAHWGPAESPEEVERWEQHQTGTPLLQVSTVPVTRCIKRKARDM